MIGSGTPDFRVEKQLDGFMTAITVSAKRLRLVQKISAALSAVAVAMSKRLELDSQRMALFLSQQGSRYCVLGFGKPLVLDLLLSQPASFAAPRK